MFKNNLDTALSLDDYQANLKPSLFSLASPQYQLAEQFLTMSLTQPHIEHVSAFDPICRGVGRVQAYRRRFTTDQGDRLWQIAAIDTHYGHIYLSLCLHDDGSIPQDTVGVLITYDHPGMDEFVAKTSFQQFKRFGEQVFHHDTVIHRPELLALFLGDAHHPYSLQTHFTEKD